MTQRRNRSPAQYLVDSTLDLVMSLEEAEAAEKKLGRMTRLSLSELGNRPYGCEPVQAAWWSLRSARDSVNGLFDTLYLVRQTWRDNKKTEARRLPQDAQELLRAAIVFSSAGFDAAMKALIEQAVPVLAEHNDDARERVHVFIREEVNAPEVKGTFRDALQTPDPRWAMLDLYIAQLKKGSFQDGDHVKRRIRSALGIKSTQVSNPRIKNLNPFFDARNQVAHEMDQTPSKRADAPPNRRIRAQEPVRDMCDHSFQLAADLIRAAASNINGTKKA